MPVFGGKGPPPPPPPVLPEPRRTRDNERAKLRATFANTCAAGFIVAGIITPASGLGVGTVQTGTDAAQVLALMAVWLVFAVILHYVGTLMLEGIE